MKRIRVAVLLAFVIAICAGQEGSPLSNPRIRHIGDNLLCKCGCGATVTSCNMLHCHYSDPARERIATLVAQGKTDEQIWEIFAKENGRDAVLTPPTQGFFLLNWVMPFIALAAGFWIVYVFIQKKRRTPQPTMPEVAPEVLSRYQDQIDKETSKID